MTNQKALVAILLLFSLGLIVLTKGYTGFSVLETGATGYSPLIFNLFVILGLLLLVSASIVFFVWKE